MQKLTEMHARTLLQFNTVVSKRQRNALRENKLVGGENIE